VTSAFSTAPRRCAHLARARSNHSCYTLW
jgi:hypothetical protein